MTHADFMEFAELVGWIVLPWIALFVAAGTDDNDNDGGPCDPCP